mgnify:CR=1 FL=1
MKIFLLHIIAFLTLISVISDLIENSYSSFQIDIELSSELGDVEEDFEGELEDFKTKIIENFDSSFFFEKGLFLVNQINLLDVFLKEYSFDKKSRTYPPPKYISS